MHASPRSISRRPPALIRLLARLAHTDVQAPAQSLPDRLSQWLAWTDAITLSSALSSMAGAACGSASGAASGQAPLSAAVPASTPAGDSPVPGIASSHDDAARWVTETRVRLGRAIRGETVGSIGHDRSHDSSHDTSDVVPDYAIFRQPYLVLQQSMDVEIGRLRNRLRLSLAAHNAEMARLATLDAIMEQALAAREKQLLATLPALLGAHYARMRDAAALDPAPGTWLPTFGQDMQSLLLAELELRLQPAEALLAALRAPLRTLPRTPPRTP